MTQKYRVAIDGTPRVYPAFSTPHQQVGHVVSLMFWERTGAWANGEEITIDAGCRTFWGLDEAACLNQLRDFVWQTWRAQATLTPL